MDISLIHAGLAAGAALAALPVILHLFMKQTPKHVIFPALRLIRERQKRSRKTAEDQELAAPARPDGPARADGAGPGAAAPVLADLARRTRRSPRRSAWSSTPACRWATSRARQDPAGRGEGAAPTRSSRRCPTRARSSWSTRRSRASAVALSPAAARKRIDGLVLRPANRPLNAAVGQAYAAVADSDRPRHEVYVLTDLARSSWDRDRGRSRDSTRSRRSSRASPPTSLRLTPKEVHDVAVAEAEPSASVATQGEPVEIRAKLRSPGRPRLAWSEFYLDGVKPA